MIIHHLAVAVFFGSYWRVGVRKVHVGAKTVLKCPAYKTKSTFQPFVLCLNVAFLSFLLCFSIFHQSCSWKTRKVQLIRMSFWEINECRRLGNELSANSRSFDQKNFIFLETRNSRKFTFMFKPFVH